MQRVFRFCDSLPYAQEPVMTFVNPKNEVAFQKIFGSEENTPILISLLNAVLDLRDDQAIQTLQVLNPYQTPPIDAVHTASFDIQAMDQRGTIVSITMLAESIPAVLQRLFFTTATVYASNQNIMSLHSVIGIGILDFHVFDGAAALTQHRFRNAQTGNQDVYGMEFHVLELPKFTKTEAELTTLLDKWVFFLKYASTLDSIPASADDAALHAAYTAATRSQWSQDDLEMYEAWLKKGHPL
jgi:predicted transposase/invertase (TIGR01784 family)